MLSSLYPAASVSSVFPVRRLSAAVLSLSLSCSVLRPLLQSLSSASVLSGRTADPTGAVSSAHLRRTAASGANRHHCTRRSGRPVLSSALSAAACGVLPSVSMSLSVSVSVSLSLLSLTVINKRKRNALHLFLD